MKAKKKQIDKEAIVFEYLSGGISLRQLGEKHGVNFRKIHDWVLTFQGKHKDHIVQMVPEVTDNKLTEVQKLQEELHKARLHNRILEAMLDIGKEDYGIDLRKKHGARQS